MHPTNPPERYLQCCICYKWGIDYNMHTRRKHDEFVELCDECNDAVIAGELIWPWEAEQRGDWDAEERLHEMQVNKIRKERGYSKDKEG